MAVRRQRAPEPTDLDPLYLRVSAKLLRRGAHDDNHMVRRATALGLSPKEHCDAALVAEAAHLAGKEGRDA